MHLYVSVCCFSGSMFNEYKKENAVTIKAAASAVVGVGKKPSGSQINKAASAAFKLEPQDVRDKFGALAKAVPKGVKAVFVIKKRKISTENLPVGGTAPLEAITQQTGTALQTGTVLHTGTALQTETALQEAGAAPMSGTGPSAAQGTFGTTVGTSVGDVGARSEQSTSSTVIPLQDSARTVYPSSFNFVLPGRT